MNKAALATSNSSPISFRDQLQQSSQAPLTRAPLSELQVNVGRLCNQACNHCHVDAGPKRTEIMGWTTMEKILAWAGQAGITKADITGGAPELNHHFRQFVEGLLALEISVTSRCNLTVLLEPGQEDLADWYAAHNIRLICSLPCYTRENVDAQRGKHVFDKSTDWGLGLPLPKLMAFLATSTELAGAIMLLFGFGVRWVSIPLMFTMLVAVFAVHWKNGWQAVADPMMCLFNCGDASAAVERLQNAKAILKEHGNYEWLTGQGNFVVSNNGIEWAVTYFIMLLVLFFIGSGRYVSVDYWIRKKLMNHSA